MYNFNYKTSFVLATAAFSAANQGRLFYDGLLNATASSNITILPSNVITLITDIVGGVALGLPGIFILKLLLGIIALTLYPLI